MIHNLNISKKATIYCSAIMVIFASSCSSSIIEKGKWEGICDNTLRVYVSVDVQEDFEIPVKQTRVTDRISGAGKTRAILLLSNYIQYNIPDPVTGGRCRDVIPDVINSGTIIHHECNMDTCAAFMDFNITKLLEIAHGPGGHDR